MYRYPLLNNQYLNTHQKTQKCFRIVAIIHTTELLKENEWIHITFINMDLVDYVELL